MILGSYVKEYIMNVKKHINDKRIEFKHNLSNINDSPKNKFSEVEHRPDLETSAECTEDQVIFFQNLIGLLRWIIDTGRIYIALEVSSITNFLANTRIVQLIQAMHVFNYLELCNQSYLPLY